MIAFITFVVLFLGGFVFVIVLGNKGDAKLQAQREIIFFECIQDNPVEWCYKYIIKNDFEK